jgi:hypothetical protein
MVEFILFTVFSTRPLSTYLPEPTVRYYYSTFSTSSYISEANMLAADQNDCRGPKWGDVADMSPNTTYWPQNWQQQHPTCATKSIAAGVFCIQEKILQPHARIGTIAAPHKLLAPCKKGTEEVDCKRDFFGKCSNGSFLLICYDSCLWAINARTNISCKVPKLCPAFHVSFPKTIPRATGMFFHSMTHHSMSRGCISQSWYGQHQLDRHTEGVARTVAQDHEKKIPLTNLLPSLAGPFPKPAFDGKS